MDKEERIKERIKKRAQELKERTKKLKESIIFNYYDTFYKTFEATEVVKILYCKKKKSSIEVKNNKINEKASILIEMSGNYYHFSFISFEGTKKSLFRREALFLAVDFLARSKKNEKIYE